MGRCFVIQPFDGGKFDKRYEDVYAPAVRAANLEPYRVDRDPGVSIPIEDIQTGIGSSEVCLADITTDNPNVWFELGYAIAARREVVLVCSNERTTKFPFDVQHRSIIKYSTDSSSDFDALRSKIQSKIEATIQRRETLGEVARIESVATVEGLEQHQLATLVSAAELVEDPTDSVSTYMIRQAMERAGFTKIATTLGLSSLLSNGMLESIQERDYDGATYKAYRVTPQGMAWLLEHRHSLTLTRKELAAPEPDDSPF